MTKYRVYERTSEGTVGQECGEFIDDQLPVRFKREIARDPYATEWTLPSLSEGLFGEPLDDLTTVVTRID